MGIDVAGGETAPPTSRDQSPAQTNMPPLGATRAPGNPNAGEPLQTDSVAALMNLAQGILAGVQGVIGEGAAQALFRYGAAEEGRRFGREQNVRSLEEALDAWDRMMGHASSGTRRGTNIQVAIQETRLFVGPHAILDIIAIGVLEGLVGSVFKSRYRGTVIGPAAHGSAMIELWSGGD